MGPIKIGIVQKNNDEQADEKPGDRIFMNVGVDFGEIPKACKEQAIDDGSKNEHGHQRIEKLCPHSFLPGKYLLYLKSDPGAFFPNIKHQVCNTRKDKIAEEGADQHVPEFNVSIVHTFFDLTENNADRLAGDQSFQPTGQKFQSTTCSCC